jgi:hypothetical protein
MSISLCAPRHAKLSSYGRGYLAGDPFNCGLIRGVPVAKRPLAQAKRSTAYGTTSFSSKQRRSVITARPG